MAAGNKSVSKWALLLVAGTAHVRVVHLVTSLLAEVTKKFGPPLPPFPPPPWGRQHELINVFITCLGLKRGSAAAGSKEAAVVAARILFVDCIC